MLEMLAEYPFACVVLPVSLFIMPVWTIISGKRRKWRWLTWLGAVWLALSITVTWLCLDGFNARHERILDHGVTPNGREYVLFQVFTSEPYDVMLHVRDASGEWRSHYHQDRAWPWRDASRVDFSYGINLPRIISGGETVSSISLKYPSRYDSAPASMTAEQVFEHFRNRQRNVP